MHKVLLLTFLGLVLAFSFSCRKKAAASIATAPAPAPAPAAVRPTLLESGDKYFEAGDYANAAIAYRGYLRDSSSAPDADRAFFRLALLYAYPESSFHDDAQAWTMLRQFVAEHPNSPYRPQAELMLRSQEQIASLQEEIAASRSRIEELSRQVESLQAERADRDRLRAEIAQREDKIRQLSQELDRLKQIDMQRRPYQPPR